MTDPRGDTDQPSALPGVRYGALRRIGDSRGSFTEIWRASAFGAIEPEAAGAPPGSRPTFLQANRSRSAAGVLRGLHYHRRQLDYWVVSAGRAFVALVDVRPVLDGRGPAVVETRVLDADAWVIIPTGVADGSQRCRILLCRQGVPRLPKGLARTTSCFTRGGPCPTQAKIGLEWPRPPGFETGRVSLMWKLLVVVAVMFTSVVGLAGTVSEPPGRRRYLGVSHRNVAELCSAGRVGHLPLRVQSKNKGRDIFAAFTLDGRDARPPLLFFL